MSNRVFVLGLDGCGLEFLNRFELPNFQKIIQSGVVGTLFSRPALTPAAWTSIVTGVNPGKHAIFDFRVGDRLLLASDKKVPELWDFARSIVINVPMTYPAKSIDGVLISGMMSPDLDSDLVQPESEREYLKKLDYVIEADLDLASVRDSIANRLQMIEHYFDYDWELFFIVFREFDVLHHFFWGQDLPYYQMVDRFLGEFLLPRLDEQGTKLIIVSDHGFAPVDKAVNIELVLEELGYDQDYQIGGWGAVYRNHESKVKNHEFNNKRSGVVEELKEYKVNGEKILDVYRNEEIYQGPYANQGPDLLVWPKRELGYTFEMHSDQVVIPSPHKNGCHLEHGVVVLHGFEIEPKEIQADIKDVFPTVMHSLGKEVRSEIDGKRIN